MDGSVAYRVDIGKLHRDKPLELKTNTVVEGWVLKWQAFEDMIVLVRRFDPNVVCQPALLPFHSRYPNFECCDLGTHQPYWTYSTGNNLRSDLPFSTTGTSTRHM